MKNFADYSSCPNESTVIEVTRQESSPEVLYERMGSFDGSRIPRQKLMVRTTDAGSWQSGS
jgi:hypothetical protein